MIWASLIEQGKRRSLISVLLAVLVFLVYLYLARFYRGRVQDPILALGWALVILNLLRAGLGHLYRLDRHPFRRFDLGLKDDRAHPGQAFALEFVVEARKPVKIERLLAELRCLNQSLTGKRWGEKTLIAERRVIAEELPLSPGVMQRFEVQLPIPQGAPSSYRDAQDRIRWEVSIIAAVTGWGDLRDQFEVTVAPG